MGAPEVSQRTPPPRQERRRWRFIALIGLTLLVVAAALFVTQGEQLRLLLARTQARLQGVSAGPTALALPQGFSAVVYADGLNGPRFFAFGADGTLYATERNTGSIVAFAGRGADGKAARRTVVASGLSDPTSVVYAGGALYVGERDRVTKLTLGPDGAVAHAEALVDDLPTGGNHTTRTVLLGAEGGLYVSIGSTCNNCVESDPRRATVWRYNADGSGGRLFARGLRNAVGLAANPWTGEVWATDMGRDLMGDDTPPETVYALKDGANYGWPRCQAGDIVDPDLGRPGDCNGVEQPLVRMQAHSAPLGLAFFDPADPAHAASGQWFPSSYRGLFVAFHGSWNRTVPTGYKVVFIPLDANGHVAGAPRDFASGWLVNGAAVTGRPVGVAFGPDGALYVSDDQAGLIYRITYQP